MKLSDIFQAIRSNRVRVTAHARKEAETDRLTLEQIYTTVVRGEIIEDYPDDMPYPSCLILGYTLASQPVHSVWAYNAENQFAVLITVYRPDPNLWIDFRERRS
jgi:hypothetical protein